MGHHHHRHSTKAACSHCGHQGQASSCSDSHCDNSSKDSCGSSSKNRCEDKSKGCGCGCKNCCCTPKDHRCCAPKSCSDSSCGSSYHDSCKSHSCEQPHHADHSDFAKKLLEVADCAWMEVLKEKIKEEILSCGEDHLDELAKIISQANHERWKQKMNKCRARADYEERVCGFFKRT